MFNSLRKLISEFGEDGKHPSRFEDSDYRLAAAALLVHAAAIDGSVSDAARDKLTVRQLAQRVGGYGGLSFVGTPALIADQMEEWLSSYGCDGFNIMFPFLPAGLDDFVDKVVPELQKRGIFRTQYEGRTLRENLGLPRPKNRFFEG